MKKKVKGFTLFEVMVAVTILSIAMVAGLVTTNSVLDRTAYLEKKVFAHWVAMNTINKLELKLTKEKLEVSSSNGIEMLRGKEYKWNLNISKSSINDIDLLNVRVKVQDVDEIGENSLDVVNRKIVLLQ